MARAAAPGAGSGGVPNLAATLCVMSIRFTARAAGVADDPEHDRLTAGIAEDEDGTGMLLLFMCGLSEPGEQDIALGQDTHCLITANQGTAYGVVQEVMLCGKVLHVKVAAESLGQLGLDDHEIEALLDVADDVIDQLRDGLRRVAAYGRPGARPTVVEL
jgi:hypothetical protein